MRGAPTYADAVLVHVPAAIMILLADPSGKYIKLACECFATVYARVFVHVYVSDGRYLTSAVWTARRRRSSCG